MIRILLVLLTGLTGCGQIGPLYLPDAPPPIYVQKDAYRDSDDDDDTEENTDESEKEQKQDAPPSPRDASVKLKAPALFPLNPTPTMANPEN